MNSKKRTRRKKRRLHDEELNLNPDEVSALASQVEAMLNDPNAVVPKYDDEVGPLIREAGKKRDKLAKDGRPVQPAPSAMTASSIRSRADLGNNPELIRAKLKAEKAKKTFVLITCKRETLQR